MRRYIPEVGALYERVRRPAITIGLGLAMVVPGGSMLLKGATERSQATEQVTLAVAGVSLGTRQEAAKAVDGPVAAAWRERALERETPKVARQYARQYGIPVALAGKIYREAVSAGIQPRVAFGLVRTESSFRRTAVSYAGAVGYTQVLPSTARWMVPGTPRSALFDTDTNLRIGFKYLRYLMNKYDGNTKLALTAYNRGPGTVDKLLRGGRNPDNGYAGKVLSRRG